MKHPSGKSQRAPERRDWRHSGLDYAQGYRLPRLRRIHGDDSGRDGVYAVGFTAQWNDFDDGGAWARGRAK